MRGKATVWTAAQAQAFDRRCEKRLGISTLVLMENAGRALADEAYNHLSGTRLAVVCGSGNNGADGLVAARHLMVRGIRPEVYLAGPLGRFSPGARINLDILRALRATVINVTGTSVSRTRFDTYGLIIDALFGVGLSRPVGGIQAQLIERINGSGVGVIAADIPSGLDATTGRVLGCCVKADTTVTFGARKRGLAIGEGKRMCGRVVVADLGIPV